MPSSILKAEDLDFSTAVNVISSAQKFVLPIPAFSNGGEPLVYPSGAVDKNGSSIAGAPIADWQGKPIGENGVVFFNGKDKSWQAAPGDGSAVVIINQVDEQQAAKISAKVDSVLDGRKFSELSSKDVGSILTFVRDDVGLVDMYNSDQGFIAGKMSRVGNDTGIQGYGLHKRDDRDICQAVYVSGKGEFQGPAATPQQFENGAVIVRQGESIRLVQPDIFHETYLRSDGAKLSASDLSVKSRAQPLRISQPTKRAHYGELKKMGGELKSPSKAPPALSPKKRLPQHGM